MNRVYKVYSRFSKWAPQTLFHTELIQNSRDGSQKSMFKQVLQVILKIFSAIWLSLELSINKCKKPMEW